MWPREGIVIKSLSRGLVIRLKNGAQIMIGHQKGIDLGDTIFILWNFHEDKPGGIYTYEEYHAVEEEVEPMFDFVLPPDWADPLYWAVEPDI
jgi:hypothetical protein